MGIVPALYLIVSTGHLWIGFRFDAAGRAVVETGRPLRPATRRVVSRAVLERSKAPAWSGLYESQIGVVKRG